MTTLLDATAAPLEPSGQTDPDPRGPVRLSANLLPAEVIADRKLTALKRRLAVGLVGLILLLGAGYGYSRWQTSQAEQDLVVEQARTTSLLNQQQSYAELVTAQADLANVQQQLATVMATDMDWSWLFGVLSSSAPNGVRISGVTGAVTGADTSGATSPSGDYSQALNRTGRSTVGTLTLSGTAPSKSAVAGYVDALAKVRGLTAVYPASVNGDHRSWTFTVNAQFTDSVLQGRYTAPADGTPSSSGAR